MLQLPSNGSPVKARGFDSLAFLHLELVGEKILRVTFDTWHRVAYCLSINHRSPTSVTSFAAIMNAIQPVRRAVPATCIVKREDRHPAGTTTEGSM